MYSLISKLKVKHLIISLIVIGFLLYINTLTNKMFWDDDDFILNNIFIRDWSYIPQFFSQNMIAGSGLVSNYWRPMLLLVFSIEWHLWGPSTIGFHLVNIIFHITNSILLFLLLRKNLGQLKIRSIRSISFLTALFFLIHPLQTEAVAYVNSLGDSLSVFFILGSLLLFLKSLTYKTTHNSFYFYFAASLFFYCLSLMSKETAIIIPGLIVLTYLYTKSLPQILTKLKPYLTKLILITTPYALIAGSYMLLRLTALNFNNTLNIYGSDNPYTQSFYIRLFTFFKVLLVYTKLMIFPTHLHMERTTALETSLLSPLALVGFFFTLILALALIYSFYQFFIKHSARTIFPLLFFGLSWFAITLFPTSNLLIPVSGLLYEHWLYLPLVGFFLIISYLTITFADKLSHHKPQSLFTFYFLLIAYFSFLSFQTIHRNHQWSDPVTFYQQTLSYTPGSYRLINNLGMELDKAGRGTEALPVYQQAISLDPTNPVAYHNLGNLYKEQGQFDSSIPNFQQAISLDPNFVYSYRALATVYFNQKDYSAAQGILTQYLDNNPPATDILLSLAQIAYLNDQSASASAYLNQALSLDPNNQYLLRQIQNLNSQSR